MLSMFIEHDSGPFSQRDVIYNSYDSCIIRGRFK